MTTKKKTCPSSVVEAVPAAPTVMPEPPTKEETPGLKSFFVRYWQFVVWGGIFLGLVLNNTVFKYMGALTYLPLLTFGVFMLAFIMRHILNKTSTDAYIHADAYDLDFASLPAVHKVWIKLVEFSIYIIVIAILASKVMGDESLDQKFQQSQIRPEWNQRLDVVIAGIERDKARYQSVEKMRDNGMPWFIVGGIHERESSRNFTRHLHEGSPLIHRTYYVPKGRLPPPKDPPYSWEESSEDALYILKHEDWVTWHNMNSSLDSIEQYNGLGYRKYHPDVSSPYLWSGTTAYSRGKYISDGRFSRISVDQQPGVAALWLRMIERNLL